MITSLKGIAVKLIKSNKSIIILSVLSVTLSIALVINMFIFTYNAQKSLEHSIKELYGEADIIVDFDQTSDKVFDKEIIKEIASFENIVEISPVIVGDLQIDNYIVYSVGLDNSKLSKSRYKYSKDIMSNELIINSGLAESLNISEGDEIIINGKSFKLTDMIDDIKHSSIMPDIIFLNINDFKAMINNEKEATHLMINVFETSRNVELADKIRGINKDIRVKLIEQDENIQANFSSLSSFISVLSILVIIMCALFVISNFQTFLYNYRKQFAIIRAIGGSSLQAFKVVFIQCSYINILGVVLGFIVSYLTSNYMFIILSDKFNYEIAKIEYPYVISIIIISCAFIVLEIFMIFPALKSSRVLPLRILGENEKLENSRIISFVIGIVGLFISSIIFVVGLLKANTLGGSVLYGIFSSIFLVLSVYILFPYYIKNILNFLLPILRFIGGNGAFVAIKNLVPQVKKNSIIILSLSTIIMIAVFGGTFFNTILINNEEYLKSQFLFDITVTDRSTIKSKLDLDFKEDIDKLQGVISTCILSYNSRLYLKTEERIEYVEFCYANLDSLVKEDIIPFIKGDLQTNVVVTKEFADKYLLKVGDIVKVKKRTENKPISEVDADSGFDKITIGAIVEDFSVRPGAEIVLDWSNADYLDDFVAFYKAIITSNEVKLTLNELEKIKTQYPQIKWTTLEQALEQSEQMLYQRWILFIIVLVAILFSLVIGIINILVNNILSKRKEYALLRTFKLDRKGLIKILLTQVITYYMLGILLGGLLGTVISNIMTLTEHIGFSRLDYSLMFIISGFMLVLIIAIFVPFGNHLAGKKISLELNYNAD